MYCDRTDLAVCGSTHIRAPYAGTGGNDVVHSPLFQVAAGIFPDQAGDDVQREQLAVMSMAAEIKVCACGCHFIQLTGLMIHKKSSFQMQYATSYHVWPRNAKDHGGGSAKSSGAS